MNNRAFQKLHMTNASRLCRRGIAAVLSGALTLGLITPGAFAWDDTADVHIPVEGEKPLITIESNGVIDDFGNLTGYLEVALRIKLPEGQTFTSLGVSLEYNSDILTPVNWVDSEGETTLVDMAGTTSDSYKTQALFRTLKDKQITTAISHVSGPYTLSVDPEEPAPGPSGEEGGEDAPAAQADGTPNGLFYIAAETSKPVTLEGDTMLAAVRFQYDLNKLDQTQNPWLNLPDGVKLPDGVDASNYDSTKWLPDGDNWLIRFAPDAVAAGSFVNQQLFYISGKGTQNDKNKFYYSEEGAASVGQVVAVKDSDGTLNRTSNLLTYDDTETTNIRFTLQNRPTYDAEVRSNFATILYYDYTNKLIGAQTVLPGDARVAVNTYVERNFIHPDLRYSEHVNDANRTDYMDSLERFYTYRGTYPAEGPDGSTVVDNGTEYPLTNKLDYKYYTRYTASEETEDGTVWSTQPMGTVTDPAVADLPYQNGWAVIDDLNNIENVWTTFGVGELGACDPASGSFTTKGESSYFHLADFSQLENGQVLYVKACYEPGEDLKKDEFYQAITEPTYERYGDKSTTDGGVYAISFSYARVNADGYGVSRMRQPSVRIDYVPDVEGVAQKPFSVGIDVENEDTFEVLFTPSSALMSMEYSLRDKKLYVATRSQTVAYNFYTGSERAQTGNLQDIYDNFNYTEHQYPEHLGSMGFVTVSTFNQIAKLCFEALKTGDQTDVNAYITLDTIKDMNWKKNAFGEEYEAWDILEVRAKLMSAYREATAKGMETLDWHQIQYHLINAVYDSATGAVSGGLHDGIPDEDNWGAYFWCRIDDCSGGSTPIMNLQDLLTAVLDYIGVNDTGTPNANALNQLTGMFELRTGITAVPFANLNAFKNAIVPAIRNLSNSGVSADDIKAMTWRQVQYILDRPSSTSIPGTVTEDYWWENGGKKTIDSLATLLDIASKIRNNGYHDSWLDGLTLEKVEEFKLRDENDGTSYTDLDKFKTDLKNAVNDLPSASTATALEVQHLLLGNSYVDHATLESMNDAGTINYWWLITPTPTDYASLLALAWQVYSSSSTADEALLEKATVALVTNGGSDGTSDFWLRGAETGAPFADEAALKAALEAAVTALEAQGITDTTLSTVTWDQFQNLLLGNAYDPNPDPTGDRFWWHNGGHRPITNLIELLEAAWNTYGGPGGSAPEGSTDAGAIDYLTDAHLEFINGLELATNPGINVNDYLYFRMDTNGTEYTDIRDFKAVLKAAVIKLTARNSAQSYTMERGWIEIQHLLLGNNYRSESALRGDKDIDYWWEAGGSAPVPSDMDYTWANDVIGTLTATASAVTNEGGVPSASDILPLLTDEVMDALNIQDGSGNKLSKNDLAEKIVEAEANAWGDGYGVWEGYMDEEYCIRLPWKVFQQYVVDGSYQLDEDIPEFSWTPTSVKYEAANTCVAQLTAYASSITNDGGTPEAANIEPLLSDAMVEALNLKDSAGNKLTKVQVAEKIVEVEANAWSDGYDVCEGYMDDNYCMNLPWKTVQQYILDSSFKKQEEIKSFMWFPAGDTPSPALYSMRMLSAMVANAFLLEEPAQSAPQENETTEITTSEDGLTTTTTHTLRTYDEETDVHSTVVTVISVTLSGTVKVTTTTVVTTLQNRKTGELTTTTATDTVVESLPAPEEIPPEEEPKEPLPNGEEQPPVDSVLGEGDGKDPEETLPGEGADQEPVLPDIADPPAGNETGEEDLTDPPEVPKVPGPGETTGEEQEPPVTDSADRTDPNLKDEENSDPSNPDRNTEKDDGGDPDKPGRTEPAASNGAAEEQSQSQPEALGEIVGEYLKLRHRLNMRYKFLGERHYAGIWRNGHTVPIRASGPPLGQIILSLQTTVTNGRNIV